MYKYTFSLTDQQWEKIAAWEAEQDAAWANKNHHGHPYYGAIGGSMTFMFTPNSIGRVEKVQHANGNILDVSEYENW